MAGFLCTTILHPALLFQAEPVSSILATTESCLPPIWIKRCAMNCRRPGGIPAPEKPWCRRSVRAKITDPWLACASSPQLAHPADDPVQHTATTQAVTARPPLRPLGSRPVPIAGWPAVTKLFRRNSASHRKAVPPSACGSLPAPACAPAPWSPPRYWSWPSSARRSVWLRRCSDGRSSPPR